MPTILISGAASGLGRAFLQAHATNPINTIRAVDRSPIDTSTLKDVSARITKHKVDLSSPDSVAALGAYLAGSSIHLVIHSAGVRGLVPAMEEAYPEDVARAETMDAMELDTMVNAFRINAGGTFLLVRALLPNLRLGSTVENPAKVVIMGSRMGSISYNSTGSAYAYRASKAAVNGVVKSFSIDIPEVIFTVFHPGRVETGLVKCREEGAIEAEESVGDMLKVIPTLGKDQTGGFFDRFGEKIDW